MLTGSSVLTVSRQRILRILSLAGLTAFSLTLAFVGVELILRYSSIVAKPAPEQFSFLESPQFVLDQQNEFGYLAHSRNRELAIYADRRNAWIEYDVSFAVNNAGLVQRKDIDRTKQYVVVVGDSFTQGQGASPWFYRLEEELSTLPLANLGVMGTGVQHWEKAVDWFQERMARVEAVAVIFITSDFSRAFWYAKSSPEKTEFCYGTRCRTVFTKLIDNPPAALAEYQRELLRKQDPSQGNVGSLKAMVGALLMKTQTGTAVMALNWRRNMRAPTPIHLEANKRSLQALRTRHKVVFALHLPEKIEATARAWSAASSELKGFMASSGVPYVDGLDKCRLGAADFHQFDGHPNAAGYQKIQECVAVQLREVTKLSGNSLIDAPHAIGTNK